MGLTMIEACTSMKNLMFGIQRVENISIIEQVVTVFCIQTNGFQVKMELIITEKMQKDVRDCRL